MREETKNKALRRLKIVRGQLSGLEKMIGDEKYCIDIITQSSAVKQALSGIEDLILENHLATHAKKQLKTGQQNKLAAEILKVYKLSKKL